MKQDGLDNKHLKTDHGPRNVYPLDPQWGNFDSSILSTYCVLEETRCVQVACGTTSCCVHLILFLRGDLRCICSTKTFMKLQGSKIIFMILAPLARIMCIILAKWQACQASLSHSNLSTFYYVQIKADKVAQKVTRMPCGELAKWRG